jgi:hypothetical protein
MNFALTFWASLKHVTRLLWLVVNGGQEVQRRAGKKCGAGVEGIARGLGWPAAG